MIAINQEYNDPLQRQQNSFTFCLLASVVGISLIALAGGIFLKHDRKHGTLLRTTPFGCYVWSDGYVQCTGRRASADGKIVIYAEPETAKDQDRLMGEP